MNWTCPFCGRDQVVTGGQRFTRLIPLDLQHTKYKGPLFNFFAIACSNKDCGEVFLSASFGTDTDPKGDVRITDFVDRWTLRPRSHAVAHKSFIPIVIYEDYSEACLIRDLSPKAAATLVRRCLQGMIRDFCKISKDTLFSEIKALKDQLDAGTAPPGVSHESVEAIDHVRGIGNIGAHMEKDVDLIVGVDASEVDTLLGLTEMLFDEWYGNRARRQEKLSQLKNIADAKKAAKSGQTP